MEKKPVIGIVGGVRQETLDGLSDNEQKKSLDTYNSACKNLGEELARAGLNLLLQKSPEDPDT